MALNRSPSIISSNVPFCSSVRLFAMDSPRPLPSVVLATSPRTKRSVSSSGLIFNGFSDTFLMVKMAWPSSSITSTYTRLCSMAYLNALVYRFSRTLHSRRPSARIISTSSGTLHTRSRRRMVNRSSNSPLVCCTSSTRSISDISSFMLPELALEASTRSSVSVFRRWDF